MALTPSDLRRRKMNLLMAMSYAAFASTKASTWSPTSLFSAGEQGAWYDPSDFSTMFQDSAGTTPVTAVEQPVGLILDKSKGLTLGSELVTNGDFSGGTTGWAGGSGATISIVSGGLLVDDPTSAGFANQTITTVANRYYKITAQFVAVTAASNPQLWVGTTNLTANLFSAVLPIGTTGTITGYFLATGTTSYLSIGYIGTGQNVTIDNVSVRELPGNHASQSTSASRPVLSARVNLLTYSEQFDNVIWAKYSVAVPVTKYADPYGGTTANLLYPTAATTDAALYRGGFATVGKTHSYAVKAAGKSWFCILKEGTSGGAAWFNLSTGLVGTVAAGYAASNPVSLGNGWYRCTVTSTSGFNQYTAISAVDADNSTTPTPNGTDGVYIWGADLRVTNDGVGIPAYQRVGAAVTATTNPAVTGVPDYDTSGFPYYIRADGTDDRLATSAIDFSGTDAVTVWAGVRKLSDAARGTVLELTASADANNGSYHLTAPNAASATYAFESKGTALTDAVVSSAVAAPITSVLTAQADISADQNILRVNGVQADSDTGDQGTGNYSNAILYIGSRGGSTLPYNGRIYGVILRGAASSAAEIASAERWMASKTGITL